MEASMLFGGLSVILAFVGAALLITVWIHGGRGPDVVVAASYETARSGRAAWWLRNGWAPAMTLSDVLLKCKRVSMFIHEAALLVEERGYATTERALLSVVVAVLGGMTLVVGVVTRSAISAVAVVVCVLVACSMGMGALRDRRREAVRNAVPDVLQSMGTCFDAGLTLLQTFRQIVAEVQGPLQQPFMRAAHLLETGRGASEALDELRVGAAVPELAFVAVALDVQHQAGGSLRQVLDAARDTVEGELALRRSLKVQTAQAKLSARVVSIMPFVLIAVFSLVSEGFLAPFFESAAGYALLAVAVGMQAAGICLVRRMLAVGTEA